MRIAYWDIETSDLNAEHGRMICASVLSLPSGRMHTKRLDTMVRSPNYEARDMTDDRELCVWLRDILEDHHLTSGWYSKGFDIPFLQSRLMFHGEKLLGKHLHLDGIWYCKGWRGIKAQSGKLMHVARSLGIKERKLVVDPDTWQKAIVGNKAAMDIIQERCESDVRLTREVTERILDAKQLVRNIQSYP